MVVLIEKLTEHCQREMHKMSRNKQQATPFVQTEVASWIHCFKVKGKSLILLPMGISKIN